MDILTFFLILLIIIIIIILILLVSNKPNNPNPSLKPTPIPKQTPTNYNLVGNENELKENIPGYENELLYENNLKDGDYVNQFTEIDFSKIPVSNNQIGFNPQPRDSTDIKLPYADININCL